MTVTLEPFAVSNPEDREALIDFMSQNAFPFHVGHRLTRSEIAAKIEQGDFDGDDHKTFWISEQRQGRIGVVVLSDLTEKAPLFDLRFSEAMRGQGLGVDALRAIANVVFETMPSVNRLEGQTREDNIPMRRTFHNAGWVKEAHYREAWPTENGEALASVAYAILRKDWESGTTTPVTWNEPW